MAGTGNKNPKLTFTEMEKAKLLIRKHTELDRGSWDTDSPEGRVLRYKDGWSDERVAREISQPGRPVGHVAIGIFRRRYIGELARGRHLLGAPFLKLPRRLDAAQMTELETRISDLEEGQDHLWQIIKKLAANERVEADELPKFVGADAEAAE